MTGQPSVLQVVILRDGLLVGTEVFVPGSFTVGSSPQAELKLDDPIVDQLHAVLYFQNGRAAIQDNNSRGGLYVNGHRVKACEVRPQDEILIGPFVLKTRVVSKQPAVPRPAPPPEVAALLSGAPPPAAPPAVPRVAPVAPPSTIGDATVPSTRPRAAQPAPPSTMISARRAAAAPPPQVDAPTESVAVPLDLLDEPTATATAPRKLSQVTASGAPTAEVPLPTDPGPLSAPPRRTPRRALSAPKIPAVSAGKGAPWLNFELYWGDVRKEARSFGPIDPKKPVVGAAAEAAAVPLWGFSLPEEHFHLAESAGQSFRVFVPPGAVVEKQGAGSDAFYPVSPKELELSGKRRFITLANGMAARFSEGEMSLVAYVAPKPERLRGNPLRGMPWLALAVFLLQLSGALWFVLFGPKPRELPDFQAHDLPPVAVKLMMPEPKKKEAAQKRLAEIKERAEKAKPIAKKEAPKPKKVEKAVATPRPKAPPPPESKALKALAKLSAAGPASNSVLAAVDKMGSGPGSKKNNFKLSGLVGKEPIANAGLGTFGLGGGGKGGHATKGLEMLNGRGGGGIGALGSTGFGKGRDVGGTVARASSRRVKAQGNIDREAVAKVINSHLQEIRGCYERALLKDPSLAGKAVLEWTISTSGGVVSVKTKSSTLRSSAVEGCILRAIKGWRFPRAKGGNVIISYPFVFNSVGY